MKSLLIFIFFKIKKEDIMQPFLKWAGSKYRVLSHIKKLLPAGSCLIEPFVGSGAVFLNTDYPKYLLADANADLIAVFQLLQKEGPQFIKECMKKFTPENNCEEVYYKFRNEFNACKESELRSRLFVYLNRHGYNGLCRYNASGGFNVPFGRYEKPNMDAGRVDFFYEHAKKAKFSCSGFIETMQKAKAGDVVYCDPPYVPLSSTSYFTAYHNLGFGKEEQIKLAEEAKRLAKINIPVLISNHDTPFTREIYAGAEIVSFEIQRLISRDATNRNKVHEILALF